MRHVGGSEKAVEGSNSGGLTMKNLSDAVEGMVMDPPLFIGLALPDISHDATGYNSNSQAKSISKSPISVVDSDVKHSHAAPSVGVHAVQLLQAYMPRRNVGEVLFEIGTKRDASRSVSLCKKYDDPPSQKPTTKSIPFLFVQPHGMPFTNINLDASTPYSSGSVNPCLTVLFIFLPTVLKSSGVAGSDGRKHSVLELIERWVPWHNLSEFFSTEILGGIWESQNLIPTSSTPFKSRPKAGVSKVQNGLVEKFTNMVFGKEMAGDDEKFARSEIEKIEDDDEDNHGLVVVIECSNTPSDVNKKRFVLLLRCGVILATLVDGFGWNEGTKWFSGILERKMQR
ncbi:hypothetical protein C8J56DRAFT_1038299 [Mycena floridula]|nr:hypothetical protein C8J56DRAFT_1038299 [Mycena floridula]